MISQKEKHSKSLKNLYFSHLYFQLFRSLSSLLVLIQNNLIIPVFFIDKQASFILINEGLTQYRVSGGEINLCKLEIH